MASQALYPLWREFFIKNPNVDSLSSNVPSIVNAMRAHSTTPLNCFNDATLFTDCCAMAKSSFPGHILFLHHFNTLGNWIINLGAARHVALFGLSDHTEVILIDPNITFSDMNVNTPSTALLLSMPNSAEFNKPIATYLNDQTMPTIMSNITFIPLFLMDDITSISSTEIMDIYFQTLASINSWAHICK
jgi:hypothetical protein